MLTNQTNQQPKPARQFHVWKCSETRHSRPLGSKPKPSCGIWSVKASKHPTGPSLMANCPACGRKSRLNPNTRVVHTRMTRDDADLFAEALNNAQEA